MDKQTTSVIIWGMRAAKLHFDGCFSWSSKAMTVNVKRFILAQRFPCHVILIPLLHKLLEFGYNQIINYL